MSQDLLFFVRDVLLRPLGNQPMAHEDLESLHAKARPDLERLARRDPDQLEKILRAKSFGAPDSHGRQFRIGIDLVRILGGLEGAGDRLVQVALDPVTPWYVRREAVTLVGKRQDVSGVRALLPVLEARGTEGEIRGAIVQALVSLVMTEALPVLRRAYAECQQAGGSWFGGRELLCDALTRLGEGDTLRQQIELAHDPHHLSAERARRTLDELAESDGGLGRILAALDELPPGSNTDHLLYLLRVDSQATVRAWALSRLARRGEAAAAPAFLEALGDPDWVVCRAACEVLQEVEYLVEDELRALVYDAGLPPSHRLWAAYTLLRHEPELELPLDSIPGYPIPVPGLPSELRRTLVGAWVPRSQPGTDVRWLIEERKATEFELPEASSLVDAFADGCRAAGMRIGKIADYAELMQQGTSTFRVVPVDDAAVNLSALAPFASMASEDVEPDLAERVRRIAGASGWTWVDEDLDALVVPGLNIYFFGRREPLSVHDLLFYWQD